MQINMTKSLLINTIIIGHSEKTRASFHCGAKVKEMVRIRRHS
jgi:hypothetical protein